MGHLDTKKVNLDLTLGVFKSVFVPGEDVAVVLKISPGDNRKTGGLPALYYLRTTATPHELVTGNISPVCGACLFQYEKKQERLPGMPRCYVDRARSILSLWKKYRRGGYPLFGPADIQPVFNYLEKHDISTVRMSAYGDPGCISKKDHEKVVQILTDLGFTRVIGYTHAWRKASYLKRYLLASCFESEEMLLAASKGWSTFTVYPADRRLLPLSVYDSKSLKDTPAVKQIECRAVSHPGTTCQTCKLCQVGVTPRHIVINAH